MLLLLCSCYLSSHWRASNQSPWLLKTGLYSPNGQLPKTLGMTRVVFCCYRYDQLLKWNQTQSQWQVRTGFGIIRFNFVVFWAITKMESNPKPTAGTNLVTFFKKNRAIPGLFFLYFHLFNTQLTVNKCSINK